MEYPAPRKIYEAPSARNLKRGDVFAVREWPPGCGPFSPPSAPSDQSQPSHPKDPNISEANVENRSEPEILENEKSGIVEVQNAIVVVNDGSSTKRWTKSTVYPPSKRRDVFANREFPPGFGPNLDSNRCLNAKQIEIETNNHENSQPANATVCNQIVLWKKQDENMIGYDCENEKPKSNSSLSENAKEIPMILETNPYMYIDTPAPLRGNRDEEEDNAALYDFTCRATINSRVSLRKTARKSVRAPSKRFLAERKSNKNKAKLVEQRIPSSTALIVYKEGIPNPLSSNEEHELSDARSKIRQLLKLFHTVYRKMSQNEESGRLDLRSANVVKESALYNNLEKAILGPVPGVQVGDEFRYRAELHLIGLHRPPQAGIDWTDFKGVRVATSIVSSGGYSDEQCTYQKLIYIGAGGKPTGKKGQKTKPEDQKLEKGNLALMNSYRLKTPVRVIHGLNTSDTSKPVMTFFYDGLYMVDSYQYVDHLHEIDENTYTTKVFKFILKRNEGQADIGFNVVAELKKSRVREGLCIGDISQRKEKIPICAINTIDNEKPPKFIYITNNVYPSSYVKTLPKGCHCKGNCANFKCSCAVKNGGEIPFILNSTIVAEKRVIYECGPACKCPPSCPNRVSQNEIIYRLEIFKKAGGEWGVRSLGSISIGTFVCEYVGEMMVVQEDNVVCIDAGERGNVARFLKRSPYPNLMVQKVLFDHDDEQMAHVIFFAAENIPPLQELTY